MPAPAAVSSTAARFRPSTPTSELALQPFPAGSVTPPAARLSRPPDAASLSALRRDQRGRRRAHRDLERRHCACDRHRHQRRHLFRERLHEREIGDWHIVSFTASGVGRLGLKRTTAGFCEYTGLVPMPNHFSSAGVALPAAAFAYATRAAAVLAVAASGSDSQITRLRPCRLAA